MAQWVVVNAAVFKQWQGRRWRCFRQENFASFQEAFLITSVFVLLVSCVGLFLWSRNKWFWQG